MRQVLKQLKQYKRDTFLCITLTGLEVVMEILLPFVTSLLLDRGLEAGSLPTVYRYGIVMVALAFLRLIFGALGGKFAASAASGFAARRARRRGTGVPPARPNSSASFIRRSSPKASRWLSHPGSAGGGVRPSHSSRR